MKIQRLFSVLLMANASSAMAADTIVLSTDRYYARSVTEIGSVMDNSSDTEKLTHKKILDAFGMEVGSKSRSVVVRYDRLTSIVAYKNQITTTSDTRDRPTIGEKVQNVFKVLDDRQVDLFIVIPASSVNGSAISATVAKSQVKVSGGFAFTDIRPAKLLNDVWILRYSSSLGKYLGTTTVSVLSAASLVTPNIPIEQSFTLAKTDSVDGYSGLKVIHIIQSKSHGRFGLRSPIADVSRTQNASGAFLTFDAIAVIDPQASNPALGAGITYNWSLGTRQEESLEGNFGFPLFFSVTFGIVGLDDTGNIGKGRPFIAPGITLRLLTR